MGRAILMRRDSGADVAEPGALAVLMRLRILVVDDDPDVLNAVARALSQVADVDVASGVVAATKRRGALPYDVVLSDDSMPDGSGRVLLRVVRERWPACLRLLMSGNDVPAERDVDPAYEHFFLKPFTAPAILALLPRAR